MDIDEVAFRQGTVKAKRYGEMQVPSEVRYVQAVKNGGKETDELVLADIAAYVVSEMDADTLYVMGSGSTCLLYTSPSPRDVEESRMPSSA